MKKVNLLAAAVVAATFMAPAANAALNADTALKGEDVLQKNNLIL